MMRFILGVLAAAAFASQQSPWWEHVKYLASDELEGRKTGTPGHTKAARYVAGQFDALKLKPAGTHGFIQPVSFQVMRLDESRSSFALVRDGSAVPLVFGRDGYVQPRGSSGKTIEAEAVFIGHGLTIPELKIDDLSGLQLKGRIAVFMRGAAKSVPGPLAAHAQSTAERWRALRDAGAIGVATIYNANNSDIPWERTAASRSQSSIQLSDSALVDTTGQQVSVIFSPEGGRKLLEGSGHTLEELLAADKAGQRLPVFPLKAKIRTTAAFSRDEAQSENVAAVLPGRDPKLSTEYVVLSAHLDHLGVGAGQGSDRIFNGAMDNASGIATMIEVARTLRDKPLKRSVLFLAVTGEEGGLNGSKFFAAYPTVPAARLVADINVDMFLPIIPLRAITVYGLDESDLGELFARAALQAGIKAERDPEPQRNIFIRSDQYSFIRRGVPALSLKFHAYPDTPEAQVLRNWLRERYHAVSDDVSQPVDINAAEKFNTIVTACIEAVANRPERPRWKAESFFRRYAD